MSIPLHHPINSPYPPLPPRKKKVWPWVLGGLSIPVLVLGGCTALVVSAGSSIDTSSSPTPVKRVPAETVASFIAPTSTLPVVPPTPAGPASKIRKDGTYLVGTDIAAGTYRSSGGDFCYWERLSALTGSFSAIIANNADEGQQFVTILPGDKAFKSQGCGTWELIPN